MGSRSHHWYFGDGIFYCGTGVPVKAWKAWDAGKAFVVFFKPFWPFKPSFWLMKILRKYQLDLIFLFFTLLAAVWALFLGLKYLGVDPHNYEWHIVGPLLLLYFIWMLKIRNSISLHERRALTGKSLFYWIALGAMIFASYDTPIPASDYWSINALYLVFTIFLADSYWDFKALTAKNLFGKSNNT